MTDEQISGLFAEGTAPESDPAFALRVAADIGRARFRSRFLALALPATAVLILSGATFVTAEVVKPMLVQLIDGAPQFMGVPVPVVLGVLAVAGLAASARRYGLSL